MKLILAVCSGLPSVYVLYYSGLLQHLFLFLQSIIVFIYEAVGYFSEIWVSIVHIILPRGLMTPRESESEKDQRTNQKIKE